MNVLFLSLINFLSLDESNIYTDLLAEFVGHGHNVIAISPIEKRYDTPDEDIVEENLRIIKPHIGNITNTPFFEKGKSLLRVGKQFIRCINEKVGNSQIDLFILATPPVTNDVVADFVKDKYNARIYLLLKDIWPGNIFKVKMPGGIISKTFVHLFFRKHEINLYNISDDIGCMSPANVKYIIDHNPKVNPNKIHVNPNSIRPTQIREVSKSYRFDIREKYNIPQDKVCFVYGGTLGPGQDVYNVVECLRACRTLDCHFLIVGRGLQSYLISEYVQNDRPENVTFHEWIPQKEYDDLIQACDVGLVFLRYDSNTPSFPSRILSYMNNSMPIVSCVSKVTDMNQIIEDGEFGWGAYSNDPNTFRTAIIKCLNSNLQDYCINSRRYLETEYNVERSYSIIMNCVTPGGCK